MKIIITILIIICSWIVGYSYKQRFIKEEKLLLLIKEYLGFLKTNIVLFKNNIIDINNQYIIMHKNKNANNYKIYLKNSGYKTFDIEKIKITITKKDAQSIIVNYLETLGQCEYELEKERLDLFLNFINDELKNNKNNQKEKGDLYYKISLSIGIVLSILVWWIYMDVSILFKIASIGILTVVISQLFQHQGKNDLATLTNLAGLIMVLFIVLSMVSDLFSNLQNLFNFY